MQVFYHPAKHTSVALLMAAFRSINIKNLFNRMDWIQLNSPEQLAHIKSISSQLDTLPIAIFKHSTRCSISSMALSRLERGELKSTTKIPFYYLDLLAHRNLSNQIATDFGVMHESPQLLLIKNGECIYKASHSEVTYPDSSLLKEIISA